MNIAIVDYGAGNIRSVQFALERLGITAQLSKDATTLKAADKVIFPGVGAAGAAMNSLKASGLDQLIPDLEQPVLGICLGMQLMCARSEEDDSTCLGIFPETVQHFPNNLGVKVPHMGWNNLQALRSDLFAFIEEQAAVYFVHSYYVPDSPYCIAQSEHGVSFSAALQRDNFYGTQFHPEKSGDLGSQILRNFIERI